ncbi:unnamed protein product [Owenia fusiformis]|uniref:MRC n=1 Tax=Owenia fusiformis TaxID=6347 RepID=A0A8S4N7G1_OWEFU|nr:unnamed protein product [Owenia fusiformis]
MWLVFALIYTIWQFVIVANGNDGICMKGNIMTNMKRMHGKIVSLEDVIVDVKSTLDNLEATVKQLNSSIELVSHRLSTVGTKDAVKAPKYQTTVICEDRDIYIFCLGSSKIEILTGNYGRSDKDICRTPRNTNESAYQLCSFNSTIKTTTYLKTNCDGKISCQIDTSMILEHEEKSCTGINKYLQFQWTCLAPESFTDSVHGITIIAENGITWDGAKRECEREGVGLYIDDSAGKQAELDRALKSQGKLYAQLYGEYWLWIGGYIPDPSQSHTNWRWENAPRMIGTFRPWKSGPTFRQGDSNYNCIYLDKNGLNWNKMLCENTTEGSICEIKRESGACPSNYENLGSFCYRFITRSMTWRKAKSSCEMDGADLYSDETIEKHNAVQTFISKMNPDASGKRWWTAGHMLSTTEGSHLQWAWATSRAIGSFRGWSAGLKRDVWCTLAKCGPTLLEILHFGMPYPDTMVN